MSVLTDADKEILPLAARENGGFHLVTEWYFKGWKPLWYQYAFHYASQKNVTCVAGIATGKTTGVAASYLVNCLTTPYFRALNTSVTAKQAELPFEMIQEWMDSNERLLHLISDVALRPYPTIYFKNGSEYIFRTAGKDARFIRGMEFDRINYDEAGLDYVGDAVKVLRGRLRGNRVDGSTRMARLDVVTSPTDAPWLRERFDRGDKGNPSADLTSFLSMRLATYDNTRLDPEQIKLMEAEYSDDMILVELGGQFPDYGMSMFPKSHIHLCTDQSLLDAAYEATRPADGRAKKGYIIDEHPRYGITKFELPAEPDGVYVIGGDPGTDSPPKRNSPIVMCFDISKTPAKLVYFDWIYGNGSYTPFLNSYKYALEKYRPVLKGMDTTGTQKAIDELAFENVGIQIDGINFQRDKNAMLNSLSLAITNHDLKWPPISGLIRQLSSYSRENDSKLAQDIVMCLAEVAFLIRYAPGSEFMVTKPVPVFRNRKLRSSSWRRR